MTERRLAAEVPRRSPTDKQQPVSQDRIDEARLAYESHIPSMFTHQCLGCDERWPCPTYREALGVLRLADQPPDG